MAVVKTLFFWITTTIALFGVVQREVLPVKGDTPIITGRYCRKDYECTLDSCDSYSKASDRCSCHPGCILFHDCCYNTQQYNLNCHQDENNRDNFVAEVLQPYMDHFQCTLDVITRNKYWMVSKCPQSWPEPYQCDVIDGDIVVGRLEDGLSSIPMVSPDGITFRNIYCAICHNQNLTTLTPWSFTAEKCDNKTFTSNPDLTTTQKVIFLNKTCQVISFHPPDNHPHHHVSMIPCHEVNDDVIDSCNEYVTDQDIINNCSMIAAQITASDGLTYKSKECLDCYYYLQNVKIFFTPICKSMRVPGPTTRIFTAPVEPACPINKETGLPDCPNSNTLVPISITFNFGGRNGGLSIVSGDEELETTHVTCDVGAVFDPIASECIYLSCQRGYTLIDMNCIKDQSINNNTHTGLCDQFTINITIETEKEIICRNYSKNITDCLSQKFSSIPELNLQHDSCYPMDDSLIYEYRNIVTSFEVLQQILSPISRNDYSNQARFCSDVKFIQVTAHCALSSLKSSLECQPSWTSSSYWSITENFTGVIFQETSERVALNELKFRYTLNSSLEPDESDRETVDVQRCHIVQTVCPLIMMNASLFRPDGNGSDVLVYVHNTSIRFYADEYFKYDNGSIQVCNFFQDTGDVVRYYFLPTYTKLETILSTIFISLSIFALSFSFLSYCLFPSLRTRIANIVIMNLCGFLLLAQILLLLAGPAMTSPAFCSIVSGFGHFAWLVAFSSSSVLGFTLVQTFSIRNQTSRGKSPSKKKIILYVSFCLIGPSVVCGLLLILYLANGEKYGITYGSDSGCWIGGPSVNGIAFGCPVAVCMLINLVFFIHVTTSICIQTRQSQRVRKVKRQWRELLIYIKVFVVLGLTWTIGFVAHFTDVRSLWYLFTILTSAQGVFVFLAFTFNSQVWDLWAKRFGLMRGGYSGVSTGSSSTVREKYRPTTSRTTETSTL